MNLEYDTSKLIETLKTILRNYGDLTVFIQGQDSGGIYPNDYVKYKLGIQHESEDGCNTILITLNEDDPFGQPSTVNEFIEMLKNSLKEHGNCDVLIDYMDSGGRYHEGGELCSVDVEEIDGEQHVVIC